MQDPASNEATNGLDVDLDHLVDIVVKAAIMASQTQRLEDGLAIRNELNRLPEHLVTEILNGVILNLLQRDPALCRWFILDVFLHNADPEGKADVAERINLLLADLQSS